MVSGTFGVFSFLSSDFFLVLSGIFCYFLLLSGSVWYFLALSGTFWYSLIISDFLVLSGPFLVCIISCKF